jgi:hypothetical protein
MFMYSIYPPRPTSPLLSFPFAIHAVHVSSLLLLYPSRYVLLLTSWDGTVVDGAILDDWYKVY